MNFESLVVLFITFTSAWVLNAHKFQDTLDMCIAKLLNCCRILEQCKILLIVIEERFSQNCLTFGLIYKTNPSIKKIKATSVTIASLGNTLNTFNPKIIIRHGTEKE